MSYNLQQKKEIERLAQITPNLKFYPEKGINKNGEVIKGYFQLKNGGIIKLSQIKRTDFIETKKAKALDVETINKLADQDENLKDFKGFGLKKDGTAKNGFHITASGKVICVKHIKVEAETVNP